MAYSWVNAKKKNIWPERKNVDFVMGGNLEIPFVARKVYQYGSTVYQKIQHYNNGGTVYKKRSYIFIVILDF